LNHRQRQMLTHWRSFWSHANSLEQLVSRGDALFDDQVRVSDLLQQIECLLAIASLDGMPQGIGIALARRKPDCSPAVCRLVLVLSQPGKPGFQETPQHFRKIKLLRSPVLQ